jgi:predicted ribonuclease toxin of YeeF-YezG toxin-antitoxin module
VAGLIEYANTHFEAAQAALRAGDFATYGDEMELVEAALQRLSELSASPGA